jgi:hypothetical protein
MGYETKSPSLNLPDAFICSTMGFGMAQHGAGGGFAGVPTLYRNLRIAQLNFFHSPNFLLYGGQGHCLTKHDDVLVPLEPAQGRKHCTGLTVVSLILQRSASGDVSESRFRTNCRLIDFPTFGIL